jgi:hypothetical protein
MRSHQGKYSSWGEQLPWPCPKERGQLQAALTLASRLDVWEILH